MNKQAIVDAISVAESEFTVQVASTLELVLEAFKLRYQVYCIERGFEPGQDEQEADEYDGRSQHVLLRHAQDGEVVGTVRIIAPNPADLYDSFPMQRVCEPSLLRHLPLRTTGEISRFAISKTRRMSCTSAVLLRLSLMRGIVQLSGEMGLTHWTAVMERSLLRLLQVSAIHFHPVGPLVSYHGIRQPSCGSIDSIIERIKHEQFPVWNYITAGGTLHRSQALALAA